MAPQNNPKSGLPHHEWFIEFNNPPDSLSEFSKKLDDSMQEENIYYKDLISGKILKPLVIKKVTRNGDISINHPKHLVTKNNNISNKALYREPLVASLDGNTVELSVEQMEFAENTMRYQTTLNFLNGKITKLISAIRGE